MLVLYCILCTGTLIGQTILYVYMLELYCILCTGTLIGETLLCVYMLVLLLWLDWREAISQFINWSKINKQANNSLFEAAVHTDTGNITVAILRYVQMCRFINWQVEAIRRTDPDALVTAGSSGQGTQSDQWGDKNLYSDHCLVTAGGKSGVTPICYLFVLPVCSHITTTTTTKTTPTTKTTTRQ